MSLMIQVLLAVVMTASGLMLSSAAQAETFAVGGLANLTGSQAAAPGPGLDTNFIASPLLSPFVGDQVIPTQFLGLNKVTPEGSLAWAGVDEFNELLAAPMPERKDLKQLTKSDAETEFNVELLTADPAPEPQTSVLAGIALAVGGIWTRTRCLRV